MREPIPPRNYRMLQQRQAPPDAGIVTLFVVIVLYKMKPRESLTLRTFQASRSAASGAGAKIKLLLYDNTPGGQDPGELPDGALYESDPSNGRLSKAYNYALGLAEQQGFDWLLTLDQDSNIPLEFVSRLVHTAVFVSPLEIVGAIVPFASSDGRIISPKVIMRHGTLGRSFQDGFIGLSLKRAHAVNSASTLRVRALRAIGGYDLRFNLWFSDIVMYNNLHRHNFRIFVAGDIHIDHELSGFDLRSRSTVQRYEEILQTEEAFYDQEMDRLGEVVVIMKLVYRLVYGLYHTGGRFAHAKIAFKFLLRRLLYSRRRRRYDWEHSVQQRAAL